MKNLKLKNILFVLAAVVMVALISFFTVDGIVSADEPEPENPEEVLPGGGNPYNRRQMLRYGGEVFLQSIADQSGVALADLQAALENRERIETVLSEAGFSDEEIENMFYTAQLVVIDQGVADGKLTEAQAAEMKERLDSAIVRRAETEEKRIAIHELWQGTFSEKLGLSVEELETLLGETRAEVIAKAVEQGLITAEEGQQWLEYREDGMGGMGRPFFGGRGGFRAPGQGQPGIEDSYNTGNCFGGADF